MIHKNKWIQITPEIFTFWFLRLLPAGRVVVSTSPEFLIRLCSRASFYYVIEDAQEINDALVTKIFVYIKLRQIEPAPFNEINEKGNKKRVRKQCTQTWRFELSSAGKIPTPPSLGIGHSTSKNPRLDRLRHFAHVTPSFPSAIGMQIKFRRKHHSYSSFFKINKMHTIKPTPLEINEKKNNIFMSNWLVSNVQNKIV